MRKNRLISERSAQKVKEEDLRRLAIFVAKERGFFEDDEEYIAKDKDELIYFLQCQFIVN